MKLESISHTGHLGDILERTAQPVCNAICSEASHLLACASERIRQNPVPIVAGAVAFGIAIGYLIVSGRHTPTFQERYVSEPLDQAVETIGSSFGRLYGNLKFW
jgi:hypothetical protein